MPVTAPTHDLSANDIRPRTFTLAEILAGAERAAARVEKWPEWKRELSQRDRTATED